MTRRTIGWVVAVTGLAALLLGVAGSGDSAAAGDRGRGGHHHHHGHWGPRFHGPRVFIGPHVFVGPRLYVGPRPYPYYGYPYYGRYYGPYYGQVPPPVVVPPPPTSYVERPRAADAYWHYCQDPAGYYPQVSQCPGGWIQVPPRSE